MADDVNIVGLNGVPAWATETTLDKMRSILEKSLGIQKSSLASGKGGLAADSLDELNRQIKDHNKSLERNTVLIDHDNQYRIKGEELYRKYGTAKGMMIAMTVAATHAFGVMKDTMIANVNTFDKLHGSGVLLTDTTSGQTDAFKNLGNMAMLASLRMQMLADVLTKYSGANAVGALKFAKALGAAQPGMTALGFNSAAAAELMGAYLDVLSGTRDIQNMSNQEIATGTLQFGKSMAKLSLAAGVTREKLMQQTAAINSSIDAYSVAAEYGSAAAEKMSMFAASFGDPAVGDAFVKMMSAKLPVLNTTFQNFAKAGMGNLGMQIANFSKTLIGLDPEEAAMRTKAFVRGLGDLSSAIGQQKFLAEAGVEGAAENLAFLQGLEKQQRLTKNLSDAEFAAQMEAAQASAKVATAWEGLKAALQKIFAPSVTLITLVGDGLSLLTEYVTKGAEALGEFDKTIATYTAGFGFELKDATASLITLVAGAGALYAAFKTMAFFIKAKQALMGGAGSAGAAGKVAGTAGGIAGGAASTVGKAAGAAGGGLSALGKGLGGLLQGLGAGGGKLIEGLMRGIAAGIGAFANPKILVGSGILSASIAVLSLGLGAASFVLGKTLPMLADGLKSFGDINGDNLIQAGKGIMALAMGIGLFGVGGVIGSAGAVLSGLTDKIGGLFGVSGPLERVKEFASIGTELERAGNGMMNLANGLNSFAQVDTAALRANADAANRLSGAGSITSWFKTPSGSAIANEQVKPETTGKTTPAMPTSIRATGSGVEQPVSDASINNLLAQQVAIMSMLLAKMESSLSVSKDMLKYIKLQT